MCQRCDDQRFYGVEVYALRFRDLVYRMHQYAFCSVHRRGMYTALRIAEWGRARRFRKSRIGVCDGAILDYVQDLWEVLSSERFVITLTIPAVGVLVCRAVLPGSELEFVRVGDCEAFCLRAGVFRAQLGFGLGETHSLRRVDVVA